MKGRIFLVAALLMSLTACKSAPPRREVPTATAPATTGVVTVRFQPWLGFRVTNALWDTLIAAFQQRYPQYRVERVATTAAVDYDMSHFTRVMRQGDIDVAECTFQNEDFAKFDLTLDAYIHRDGLDLKPFGNLMEQGLIGGHTYALPVYLQPLMLSADVNLLSAAGVTLPEQNWTWEAFRAAAKKAATPLGEQPTWAVRETQLEDMVMLYLEGQADRRAWNATDAELKDALAYLQTLVNLDRSIQAPKVRDWEHYPPLGGSSIALQWEQSHAAGGRFAFDFGSFLIGPAVAGLQSLPAPAHPGRPPVMFAYASWLQVANGSRNPDAAWAFVKFAAGPEGAVVAAKSGFLPAYLDATVEAAWFESEPTPAPITKAFFNAKWLLNGVADPRVGQYERNQTRLARLTNRVLAQGMEVDAALDAFHKEMDSSVPGK